MQSNILKNTASKSGGNCKKKKKKLIYVQKVKQKKNTEISHREKSEKEILKI